MMSKSKRFVGFFASCTRALVVRSKTGRFKLFAPVLSTLREKFFQNIGTRPRTNGARTL
jgi:hypothetical protein